MVIAAQLVDLAPDRLKRRLVELGLVLAPRRQLSAGQQLLERNRATRDPALDRPARAAADLGRCLIGKAARSDEYKRLALRLRQVHQRALQIPELDMAVLA